MDRLIQQALLQVLQPLIDPGFSAHSDGFRPGRSAQQAVLVAQQHVQAGCTVVVDVDLEKFFDRVNHDILMDRLAKRIADKAVLRLIRQYLQAGIVSHGVHSQRVEGPAGCGTGCGHCSSSSGGAARRRTAHNASWVRATTRPHSLPDTCGVGGAPARWDYTASCLSRISIDWASLNSPDLNFSNRLVRTRMPGGVEGARSALIGPCPDRSQPVTRRPRPRREV